MTVKSWILCSVDIRNRFIIWCPFIPSFTCQFHNNNKNLVEKVWSNCLFLLEILVINFVLLLVNYYWHHLGTSFNHRKYYHVLRVFVTRIYSISGIRQNLHCAKSRVDSPPQLVVFITLMLVANTWLLLTATDY